MGMFAPVPLTVRVNYLLTIVDSAGQAELVSTVDYIGRPVEHALVTVDCPQATAAPSITAEVAGDHLYINMPGCKQLDIHLHFAVFGEDATAQLLKDNKQLSVKLPYMPCRTYVDQVRTNSQLAFVSQVQMWTAQNMWHLRSSASVIWRQPCQN